MAKLKVGDIIKKDETKVAVLQCDYKRQEYEVLILEAFHYKHIGDIFRWSMIDVILDVWPIVGHLEPAVALLLYSRAGTPIATNTSNQGDSNGHKYYI